MTKAAEPKAAMAHSLNCMKKAAMAKAAKT